MKLPTIKKNREFRAVYKHSQSIADQNLVLYKMGNNTSSSRFGITVSSKVGNAVKRNKIKRRLKEILSSKFNQIAVGYDIIFVVRVKAAQASFQSLEKSVDKLLDKASLHRGN
ncbi:MAG: ribonuclease P protein component [Eubacteriaceae bacterium]|nr:ribonuclease P protein component [Eubacteriaceae bacterium]